MFFSTTCPSPVGLITLASDGGNLIGLWIEGQKYHGNSIFEKMTVKDNVPVFKSASKWLEKYFSGKNPDISGLPLAPIGSEFRQCVWQILCEIPYGKIVSYSDIAKKIISKMNRESMSSRAVGGAVGHNPISIIIPCHRVVGSNGSLTGFSAGLEIKSKLLELEGINIAEYFVPLKGTAL